MRPCVGSHVSLVIMSPSLTGRRFGCLCRDGMLNPGRVFHATCTARPPHDELTYGMCAFWLPPVIGTVDRAGEVLSESAR